MSFNYFADEVAFREQTDRQARMAGSSQQYAAIEIGHEAARLNAVLQSQISEVRREVARMGLRAEDE